jgi:hypothetical protein
MVRRKAEGVSSYLRRKQRVYPPSSAESRGCFCPAQHLKTEGVQREANPKADEFLRKSESGIRKTRGYIRKESFLFEK